MTDQPDELGRTSGAGAPTAIELGQLYISLHGKLRRLVDDAMCCGGASLSRTMVLKVLAAQGPLKQSELAAEFGFAPRSVTDLVDGLEREGLAERLADPSDKRARLVSITESGASTLESALKIKIDLFEEIFSALDPDARKQLYSLLHTIQSSLPPKPGEANVH